MWARPEEVGPHEASKKVGQNQHENLNITFTFLPNNGISVVMITKRYYEIFLLTQGIKATASNGITKEFFPRESKLPTVVQSFRLSSSGPELLEFVRCLKLLRGLIFK